MPFYCIQFVDDGDNVYRTHYLESYQDEGAIAAARRLNVSSVGDGFELWQEARLVHSERNIPPGTINTRGRVDDL